MPKVFSTTQISRWKEIVIHGTMHGHSLHRILKRKEMCSRGLVYSWLNPNHGNFDRRFTESLAQARIDSADKVADEIEEICRDVLRGDVEPKAARVAIMGLQWIARVRNPKKYGERIEKGLGGEANLIQQIYQIQLPANGREGAADVEGLPQLGTVHVPTADTDAQPQPLTLDIESTDVVPADGPDVHNGATSTKK